MTRRRATPSGRRIHRVVSRRGLCCAGDSLSARAGIAPVATVGDQADSEGNVEDRHDPVVSSILTGAGAAWLAFSVASPLCCFRWGPAEPAAQGWCQDGTRSRNPCTLAMRPSSMTATSNPTTIGSAQCGPRFQVNRASR
jgi:hypothetical protein